MIDGTLVKIVEVCYVPDWTCVQFDAATFPQDSTGQLSYAGVTIDSGAIMRVDANHVLVVTPPGPGFTADVPADDIRFRPLPFVDVDGRFGVHPLPAAASTGRAAGHPDHSRSVPSRRRVLLGTASSEPGHKRWRLPHARSALGRCLRDWSRRQVASRSPTGDPDRGRARPRPLAGWWTARVAFRRVGHDLPPQPVTRVRVDVDGNATVTIVAGATLVASAVAQAGAPAILDAGAGWIDRVSISAAAIVRVREVCTEAGDFGWQRFEQWAWRESIRRSLSRFTSDAFSSPPATTASICRRLGRRGDSGRDRRMDDGIRSLHGRGAARATRSCRRSVERPRQLRRRDDAARPRAPVLPEL